ncbi:MAG: putative phosphoesterase, Icc family [Candidatus Nanosalina sp. J07AB43]|nr:MAG: putative phosphoesterase, Icc family [Candidatus Nanosalina sp. J07AB43]
MRILLVTDIHGDHEKLSEILEKETYKAILCAGDLSDAEKYDEYNENLKNVVEEMDREEKFVKAVPGNMDPERECVETLRQHRINLHREISSLKEYELVGYGGGITPFGTPFEPEGSDIKNALETLQNRMRSDNKIALIHQPPEDTEVDIADGQHVGSEAVRDLLTESEFDLAVTGHIHESRGTDSLEGTKVVNPGPVMQGFYAVVETDGDADIELKSL